MFSFIKPVETKDIDFDLEGNLSLLRHYLVDSVKKTNYLYWNIINFRYQILLFTNAKNTIHHEELIRPGNPNVLIKLLKVKNKDHWLMLQQFFMMMIGHNRNDQIPADIYVFKITDIFSYLKKIKYDKNKLCLVQNIFNTIYGEFEEKRKKLIYIEGDIFTFQKLYNFYILYKSSQKSSKFEIVDIIPIDTEDYKKRFKENQNKFEIIHNDNHYNIIITKDGHLVPVALTKQKKFKYKQRLKLIQHKEEKYLQFFTELKTNDFDVIAGYPNIRLIEENEK